MARKIIKTLNATRVTYKTVAVNDGVPSFVDHPDAVFSGILDRERVERLMRQRCGKDVTVVITNIDAGTHRYEMDLEQYVLNATVADGSTEPEDDVDEPEEGGEVPAISDDDSDDDGVIPDEPAEPSEPASNPPTDSAYTLPTEEAPDFLPF